MSPCLQFDVILSIPRSAICHHGHSIAGKHPTGIPIAQRIPIAVRKHVISGKSLSRGSIAVRVDKPSPNRVIVPAAEIVEPRLGVIDVPAVAQGIHSTQRGGHGTADGHGRTPGVVGVGHHLGAAGVYKTGNVALGVSARIQMSTL